MVLAELRTAHPVRQTDVHGLTARIKDLETKLRRLAASAERKGRPDDEAEAEAEEKE